MAGALNHTSTTGIHPDELLISEICKGRGYATACFGKWHLGTRTQFDPNHNGFDRWFGLPYSNDNGPLHPSVRGIPSLPLIEDGKTIALDPDQSTFSRIFTEKAIEFITANKSKPFFLYVPHVMPHVPIAASEKFKGSSTSGLYGDVVQEEDYYIGELLKSLDANGIANNTIVLFLSDNGPFLSYGSHAGSATPFREGKLTTFEGGVRVPMIVRWPGHVPAERQCDEMITGLDLLPTLAKLIDAQLPKQKIDGEDLSQLLLGTANAKGRGSFAYYSGTELHAVRRGPWKLHLPHDYITVNGPIRTDGKPANYDNMKPVAIEESGVRGIASRHGYKVESLELSLFNLLKDPGEKRNVASEHPEIVEQLKALASAYRKELGDSIEKQTGTGARPVGRE
jgi:arylsulfatase